jgi:hypothetical protein
MLHNRNPAILPSPASQPWPGFGERCACIVLGPTIAVALALCALLPSAHAETISYSQGTLTFNEANRVTVGTGGDFATCNQAVKSFPVGGSGGIIEFLPGNHVDSCYAANDRGNLLITGRLGPNGERPRITSPTTINPNNGISTKDNFLTFNPRAPRTMVIENLEIYDTGGAITASNYGGMILRNVFINGTTGGNGIIAAPPYGQYDGQWSSWFELYNSEVARAGSGNTKHNIYLSRLDRVVIDGLYSHSARNSHTLKIVARDVIVRNSVLLTTDKAVNNLSPGDEFLSTTLLDIAACANSTIANNQFVGVGVLGNERSQPGWGASTQVMIDLKRRRDLTGCDEPPYGSATFNDPTYWANAAAGGYDKSNPYLFQHLIHDNTFINMGAREIGVVWNNGTGPWDPGAQYQFNPTAAPDLPVPPGWFERAVAWLDNNDAHGNLDWGREVTNTTHPASTGNPIFVDGVRVGSVPDPTNPIPATPPGQKPTPTPNPKPSPPQTGKPVPTTTPATVTPPKPQQAPRNTTGQSTTNASPDKQGFPTNKQGARDAPGLLGRVSRAVSDAFAPALDTRNSPPQQQGATFTPGSKTVGH